MRKFIFILAALVVALPASAQRINLDVLSPALADKAEEVVDVTLDASMIRIAASFLGKGDRDERAIRDLLQPLEGIYVRSYDFGHAGEYDMAIVDKIKSQLGPSWKPMVTVKSRKKENVNVYADMRGDRVLGIVVIAAEPSELTIVNIVGPIDIDRLAELSGHFGIPDMDDDDDHDRRGRRRD